MIVDVLDKSVCSVFFIFYLYLTAVIGTYNCRGAWRSAALFGCAGKSRKARVSLGPPVIGVLFAPSKIERKTVRILDRGHKRVEIVISVVSI